MTKFPTCAAFIFDLDGTVLDTLPDLVALTNVVMEQFGHTPYSREDVLGFVGDGAEMLLHRCFAPEDDEQKVAQAFALWQKLYPEYGHKDTKPYQGMPETLAELKHRGCKLGVLSNKFDAAANEVIARHYPGVFDAVWGEGPAVPRKPNPLGLIKMMEYLEVAPAQVAYVGDSKGDMLVACRAGALPLGVTWGYQSVEALKSGGAKALVDSPEELLAWALQLDEK